MSYDINKSTNRRENEERIKISTYVCRIKIFLVFFFFGNKIKEKKMSGMCV